MSSFDNLLGRLNYLSEARGEGKGLNIRGLNPHLGATMKHAAGIAKRTHPNVFSRHSKNSVLTVIDIILDTDFTEQFLNEDQATIVKYWHETQDEDGVPYSTKIAAITMPEIEEAVKSRGITGEGTLEDIVQGSIYNLRGSEATQAKRQLQAQDFAQRPAAQKITATSGSAATASLEELMLAINGMKMPAISITTSSKGLADAAYQSGDAPLGDTISNIGDTALRTYEGGLVKISVYKMLIEVMDSLGDPGVDIDEEAFNNVVNFVPKLNSLDQLKALIRQIKDLPEYETLAFYLFNTIKPIKTELDRAKGLSEEEEYGMEEEEIGVEEYYDENEDPSQLGHHEVVMSGRIPWVIMYDNEGKVVSVSTEHYDGRDAHVDVEHVNAYLDRGFPIGRAIGAATSYPSLSDEHNGGEDGMMMGESASPILNYMSEIRLFSSPKPVVESVGFREKYKPKTSKQLAELKSYGM